jgi:YfiH family protein
VSVPFETGAALAGLPHGFFGRRGGVSSGDFTSLNVSLSNRDDPANAQENRRRVTAALDHPAESLVTVRQVHSPRVVSTDAAAADTEADALVTATPGLLLGILTADCCPILFADIEAGVVGAAHAGWRGAVEGVVRETVAAMVALGARRTAIRAAIGPTISGPNYEVGADFRAEILARDPGTAPYFSPGPSGKQHFDLPGFVAAQLAESGIAAERVGTCTYADPERYFSHRRGTHEGRDAGRQIAVIGLGRPGEAIR